MATAEALMELVPNGHSKRTMAHTNGSGLEYEDENSKERAMAATYAAYTKRTKLHAEKAKAQQLSRQLKTRLQFARLKVDYGWTRQSLNEVENLYFHLSVLDLSLSLQHAPKSKRAVRGIHGPLYSINPRRKSFIYLVKYHISPWSFYVTGLATISYSVPSSTCFCPVPKRHGLVERTRTGGIVRSQPPERLRTGGKVKPPSGVLSPKKRGRPRLPDESESTAPMSSTPILGTSADGTVTDGTLTYDSFWSSLNSLKTPTSS
ncbi:3'-5' exonuclease [Rhizoctonia solani]|uniref:3'-5' exonuclease n=1 Tax=Rhizoctonia solani TaxID=456999 RepID=A0A8H7I9K4_9AGAM|nr:3'-5' exonuclease [Rhizoctonia solani]